MELPNDFKERMQSLLGDQSESFFSSLETPSPTSVRINQAKSKSLGLTPTHFKGNPVQWCNSGIYLSTRPVFTSDPIFHAGAYYVQEASSMFLQHLIASHLDDRPIKALDFCAAPGGKSTLLASALPIGSILFSNEFVRSRSKILCENMIKWGNPNIVVTNNSSLDYSRSGLKFDMILCDVPCSGEGMFRKDPVSISEWSLDSVKHCCQRQHDIILDMWNCLSPGGLFIYSTCTYNTDEDEKAASFIEEELGGIALSLDVPSSWGIDIHNYLGRTTPVFRFFPHRTIGEGFFICAFRKPHSESKNHLDHKRTKSKSYSKISTEIKSWIRNSSGYTFRTISDGIIYAFASQHTDIIEQAFSCLKVIHSGVEIAHLKGKKYVPSHSLAMSNILAIEHFPLVEVDTNTALSYLRCESLNFPDSPRGYLIVSYNGYPLGFVNNIGSRANNLYPSEWRIRHL